MSRFEFIAVYIVTGNLIQRTHQHREGFIDGFSKKYGCKHLVWFEQHQEMTAAIAGEKNIKKWRRAWKLNLIETANPQWRDLYDDFSNPPPPTFLG